MTSKAAAHTLPYRPCVGITLFNAKGLVFIGKRLFSDHNVSWQMPQGGIDKGEEPEAAALRELEEEVGTAKAEILAEHPEWLSYDLPPDLMGKALKGRYRGQKQKWFAMRFTGVDSDINIHTDDPEFSEWRWSPIGDVPGLIVDFKRAVYDSVVAEFRPLAERLARAAG